MTGTGVRSGLLMIVLGVWILLRVTRHDSSGRTLADHILDPGTGTGASSSASTPGSGSSVFDHGHHRTPLIGSGFLSLPWAQRAAGNILDTNPGDSGPLSPGQKAIHPGATRGGVIRLRTVSH